MPTFINSALPKGTASVATVVLQTRILQLYEYCSCYSTCSLPVMDAWRKVPSALFIYTVNQDSYEAFFALFFWSKEKCITMIA